MHVLNTKTSAWLEVDCKLPQTMFVASLTSLAFVKRQQQYAMTVESIDPECFLSCVS